MSITTGWDQAAGATVAQCPSLMDAPSLPPQETLFFSAMYLVGDETARGGVSGGKGAGQAWGQLSGGDGGVQTGPRQGDNKEDKAHFPV